jgi:hypothetical protein
MIASQRTPLVPISAARMLNNYNDKMPRANPEPNTIASLLKGGTWRNTRHFIVRLKPDLHRGKNVSRGDQYLDAPRHC